jgi:pimeloyl-ACP methyl ester carboxylesterase
VKVTNEVKTILQFPTDTVSIDFLDENGEVSMPQTILVFVPGNPGLIHWYAPMLKEILDQLGPGFSARGLSYAGHGLTKEMTNVEQFEGSSARNVNVAWTVDGQIQHKIAYMDELLRDLVAQWGTMPRFIFLSHSIGSHLVQRMCVLRPDILKRTILIIHLMPFIRMDAPFSQQIVLNSVAQHCDSAIMLGRMLLTLMSKLPREKVDQLLAKTVPGLDARNVAVDLVRLPTFARNLFELGGEEIRALPQKTDESALRILGSHCRLEILFAAGDQWAPLFHAHDLHDLQQRNLIPKSIEWLFIPELKHDYVVHPQMVPPVLEFCIKAIRKVVPKARL